MAPVFAQKLFPSWDVPVVRCTPRRRRLFSSHKMIGALAFGWLPIALPFALFVNVLVVGIALHVTVNVVGHLLRLRRTWM
jgi:hypothetical protein